MKKNISRGIKFLIGFAIVVIILAVIQYLSLVNMGSNDFNGPILLLIVGFFGLVGGLLGQMPIKNKVGQMLRNMFIRTHGLPLADDDMDDYVKKVRTPISYFSIYLLVGIGLVWVIYYWLIQ